MTGEVRLLRCSVDPVGQGDASADKGDLGPIGADSSSGRDAPVTHAEITMPDPVRWCCAEPDDCDRYAEGLCPFTALDLTAPERRWESAWGDRGNWR